MKQVEVTIMGQGYVLGCPDGGDTLLSAAVAAVDHEMSAIRDSGKVRARERIAVLSALNLAYQLAECRTTPGAKPSGSAVAPDGEVDVVSLVKRIDSLLDDDDRLL